MDTVKRMLRPMAIQVEGLTRKANPVEAMKASPFDMFLIDGEWLNSEKWKILNTIDQHDPEKPVVLLVEGKGNRTASDMPDPSCTLLDRKRFLKDAAWATAAIKKCLA